MGRLTGGCLVGKDEGTKRQMRVVVGPFCVPFLRGRRPEVGVTKSKIGPIDYKSLLQSIFPSRYNFTLACK